VIATRLAAYRLPKNFTTTVTKDTTTGLWGRRCPDNQAVVLVVSVVVNFLRRHSDPA
jgi:hypothetical protein